MPKNEVIHIGLGTAEGDRALRRLVAERVMGWSIRGTWIYQDEAPVCPLKAWNTDPGFFIGQVIGRLEVLGLHYQLTKDDGVGLGGQKFSEHAASCQIWKPPITEQNTGDGHASDPFMPIAVGVSALSVVAGVSVI